MNIEDISALSYKIIKYGVILAISIGFTVLIVCSALVHDTKYITENPKFFVSETLVMGLLTALPVIYISFLRGGVKVKTIQEFALLFFKIAFIHIGFQLSGVYSVLFPNSA